MDTHAQALSPQPDLCIAIPCSMQGSKEKELSALLVGKGSEPLQLHGSIAEKSLSAGVVKVTILSAARRG